MKGKLLKIERELPEQVRYIPEDYLELSTRIRIQGGNPYSSEELSILFEDLSDVRIVTKKGYLVFFYQDEVIRFDFYPGFAHNTASVPSILKPIVDNDSIAMAIMALPHDGVYTGRQMTKKQIDKLFVDGIEYYHEQEESENFFFGLLEDAFENSIETAIEFAFSTDEAQKSWDCGEELSERSGAMMKVTRTEV